VFSPNIRLSPALNLQVAVATELRVVLENIGVFPAGTLAIYHSQNVTILTSPLTNVVRTYAFKASTLFKAEFVCTNMSKIERFLLKHAFPAQNSRKFEFPSLVILTLFMVASLFIAVVLVLKKRQNII
jgi:hypothetical protein